LLPVELLCGQLALSETADPGEKGIHTVFEVVEAKILIMNIW
jgi:hypothetical protein